MTTDITDDHKARAQAWFEGLRDKIVAEFEAIEREYTSGQPSEMARGSFVRTSTKRTNEAAAGRRRTDERCTAACSRRWA